MKLRLWFYALISCFLPFAAHAATVTYQGGAGNTVGAGGNWVGGVAPTTGDNLVFGTVSPNNNVGFNVSFNAGNLTFTSAAVNPFNVNGNNTTLGIGGGGITTQSGNGGVTFNSSVSLLMLGNQTWTTDSNVTVLNGLSANGNLPYTLTKAGTGSLTLSGNNIYTGDTVISAGTLYLGTTNNSTGTISVGAVGTLGTAFGDITLNNAVTLANGATLGGTSGGGGQIELAGTTTLGSAATTLNVGHGTEVKFSGTLTGPSSTAFTVHGDGTGSALLKGAQTNIDSMTADNAAIAFGNASSLPTTQVQAINGGYVSIADVGATTPTMTALIAKITDKTNFNGTIGFDTSDQASHPTTFSDNIDLTGFTAGQVRIGSATSAILTGTITPVAQSYDFGGYAGQGGFLVVQSALADHGGATGVSVVSPSASGGAPQNGLGLILQGANSFTGNLSVSYSAVLLDSATAAGAGSGNFSLGNYSYMSYTEATGYSDFADFKSHLTASTSTSILGFDTHATLAAALSGADPSLLPARTVSDAIDLSSFSSIYLGTVSGATLTGAITAPTDHTLGLVNIGDFAKLTVASTLASGNVDFVIAGMAGSHGAVVLTGANTYAGGTSLLGGVLLAGNNSALGSGAITAVNSTGGTLALGASTNGVTLANNLAVTGNLNIGAGGTDDNNVYTADTNAITLSGTISGTGRLFLTTPTTVTGTNTYSGGTYVEANTTVTNNSALGSNFADLGYNAVLTVDTPHLTIGTLANAGNFINGAGTGNLNFTANALDLTINQTSTQSFSGSFTGTAANLIKTGGAQLTLLGANGTSIASTSIVAGSIAIGDGNTAGVAFGGNVNISVTGANTGLFFRPAASTTLFYNGNITGAGAVTLNGSGTGTLVATGSSSFTGATIVNAGTLQIGADNAWSSVSATTVNSGSTFALKVNGNQTFLNLSGGGKIDIASGKVLTVNSTSGTTLTNVISGAGGMTKTGASTLTLTAANTYTGNTTISGGTLLVNNALGSTSITVDSGAFLKGTGTLHDLTLNGTYSPGISSSAGLGSLDSVTMSNSSILLMELGGTTRGAAGYDALNVANAFTADGTLQVTFINSFNPTLGNSFNLLDWGSTSGTFDTLSLQSLGGGLAWDTSALYTTGVISVTAVPEPATSAALAGLGMLGLAILRRRRSLAKA
jgi:fibronectin-binding autotransporter adhesin